MDASKMQPALGVKLTNYFLADDTSMRTTWRSVTSVFVLATTCLCALSTQGEDTHPRRLLFYNRSAGYEHSVVQVKDDKPCYAETILRPICEKQHWELVSTKDGDVFTPENIAKFDAFLFYTTGDLTAPPDPKAGPTNNKPMSKEGKKAFLDAVHSGKGFVGFHCAADTFHSEGGQYETQPVDKRDPYINMIGGEFIMHGAQQDATMKVVDNQFPGTSNLGKSFKKKEEWYSLKNFADDLHVILVNETNGMQGAPYQRPAYPATWIRKYGTGRVFYTSMGHREDVWTSPEFQNLIISGITWAVGDASADTEANIKTVTPQASEMPPEK
jgi:hypothetical protein